MNRETQLWPSLGAALAVIAMVSGADAGAQEAERPAFATHRFNEDWRPLCDPAARTDPFDALKCITLGRSATLTLGGDARARFEAFDNPGFGLRGADRAVLLQRLLLHADLRLGDVARGFVQFGAARAIGRSGPSTPTDTDRLDVIQGFLDLSAPLSAGRATLRAGRQELSFGSSRLVSTREGANVRRSFDGVRGFWTGDGTRIDLLYVQPVLVSPQAFDNRTSRDEALWGAYLTGRVPGLPGAGADLYYLGYRREQAPFAAGTADETRHTFGVRFFGDAAGLDWDVEAAAQLGRFGSRDIRAWTVATDAGYTFADLPLRPRLGLRANVASGDGQASDGRLGTFNALYPKLSYFSEASLVAPANLMDVQPSITITPAPGLELSLGWNALWRHRTADAVYGPPLLPILGTAGRPGRFTGHQVILGLGWRPTPSVTVAAEYVHFEVGDALRGAGGRSMDFLTVSLAYRF